MERRPLLLVIPPLSLFARVLLGRRADFLTFFSQCAMFSKLLSDLSSPVVIWEARAFVYVPSAADWGNTCAVI